MCGLKRAEIMGTDQTPGSLSHVVDFYRVWDKEAVSPLERRGISPRQKGVPIALPLCPPLGVKVVRHRLYPRHHNVGW